MFALACLWGAAPPPTASRASPCLPALAQTAGAVKGAPCAPRRDQRRGSLDGFCRLVIESATGERGITSAARSARSRCPGEQASPTEKPRELCERVPRGKGAVLRARQRAQRVKCRATPEALKQQRERGARPKGCTKPPLLCLTHRAERGRLCTKAWFCGEGAMRPQRAERATGAQPPNGQPDGAVPRPAAVVLGVPFRADRRAHAQRGRERQGAGSAANGARSRAP